MGFHAIAWHKENISGGENLRKIWIKNWSYPWHPNHFSPFSAESKYGPYLASLSPENAKKLNII